MKENPTTCDITRGIAPINADVAGGAQPKNPAHGTPSPPKTPPLAPNNPSQADEGSRESLIASIQRRDPAAGSGWQIALCHPGLHALLLHRLANRLWRWGLHFPARLLAYLSRMLTGIEIHPAATIGRNLLIDHGSGVVIGETAVIGDNVTLYQGVTLGGTSLYSGQRHPTLGDQVVVGAGAKVLGAIQVGSGARVGANAVVLADVPADAVVVGVPARIICKTIDCKNPTPTPDAPLDLDPRIAEALPEALAAVERKIADLQAELTLARQRLQRVEQVVPADHDLGQGI